MISNYLRRERGAGVVMATLVMAVVVALAGCSSSTSAHEWQTQAESGSPAVSNSPSDSSTKAMTDPASASPVAEPNALHVDALESGMKMSFRISGTPHAGLVAITLQNKGKYAHEVGLARTKPGVTLAQVRAALTSKAPDAEAKAKALQADPDHEISAPGILGPGLTEQVIVPLVAGHYIVTCFLPGPGGMPHAAMGMIDEFSVAADSSSTQPPPTPPTGGVIALTDSSITVPAGFGTGGTFEVQNTGAKPHDFSLAKLTGKPLLDYFGCVGMSFAKVTPVDKCPGTLEGGVSFLAPGASAYLTITLPAGTYNFVSTQGDGADFQAGLSGALIVK